MQYTQHAPPTTQPNRGVEDSVGDEEVSFVDLLNPLDARFEYEMPSLQLAGLDKPVESLKDLVPLFMYELEKHYRFQIIHILRATDTAEHYSLVISGIDLLNSNPGLFNAVINYPAVCLPLLDTAFVEIMGDLEKLSQDDDILIAKANAHVRISNLPQVPAYFRTSIPTSDDVGKLVSVTATVTRSGPVNMVVEMRMYECPKCHGTFPVRADVDRNCQIVPPVVCMANEIPGCKATKFKLIPDDQGHQATMPLRSYQEIKIQEQVNKLSLGTIPRSIIVAMQDDLIDSAKSGDDVLITGVVRRRWKNVGVGDRCQIELYLLACHIHVRNDARSEALMSPEQSKEFEEFWKLYQSRPLEGRNLILASFSPKIYGLYLVKLAVMLALVGGVQKVSGSNHRVRGEPHLLLVGDPGTGKSQFLKFAAKLIPRSVLTTGIGSSSAGLTVTAVMDKGEWQLEAGALILADRGLCCIDEFDSIREHDKVAIHEAMEQQSISIAKAGMVCKLNSRCSVIAATNPKGKYDPNESLSVNLALASPLLSRFDLILVLLDSQNEEWDGLVSSFILQSECDQLASKDENPVTAFLWSVDKLKGYIAYTKQRFMPRMTQDCQDVLTAYYRLQRSTDQRSAARTTLRLLESLIRLSQAHARLMSRDQAIVLDAIQVILIMEYSMANSGSNLVSGSSFPSTGSLQSSSPDNPDMIYRKQEKAILEKLGLKNISSQPFSESHPGRELFEEEDDGTSLDTIPTQESSTKSMHPLLRIPKPPPRKK